MRNPTFTHERELSAAGYIVIGIDEAGCGCLAGPVVAAAVHLPIHSRIREIRDSKLLTAAQRERLFAEFEWRGYRWSIGSASPEEIDVLNIRRATYLAMERAVRAFLDGGNSKSETRNSKPTRSVVPSERSERRNSRQVVRVPSSPSTPRDDARGASVSEFEFRASNFPARPYALVDAWTIPNLPIPQRAIIHGDRLVKSIAAASIIAKVTRDALMEDLDREHPQYGFAAHKGYATEQHRISIARHGASCVHRRTFLSAPPAVIGATES